MVGYWLDSNNRHLIPSNNLQNPYPQVIARANHHYIYSELTKWHCWHGHMLGLKLSQQHSTREQHPTREQNLQNNPRKKRQRSRAQFICKIILWTYVFCCCWSWQYMHRPVNLQISTCQNDMLLLQICISY